MSAVRMTARDWLMLVALSVLWGGSFFFVAVAVQEIPPLTLVLLRTGLAAGVLLLVLRLTGIALPQQREVWLAFTIMGLLNNVAPFTLIAWGQSQIPSGLAAILNATTPISTALVAHVFTQDEKLTANRIIGVLLGLAGVVAMLGPDLLSGLGTDILPQAAVLLATMSYACAGVYGRRFRQLGIPPLATAAGQLASASLILLPMALLLDRPWTLPLPALPVVGAVLGLVLLSTALAYVLFFRVLASAGSNVNLVTLLVPVSAILLGVLVLDESLSTRHMIGIAAVALGLVAIDGRLLQRIRPAR